METTLSSQENHRYLREKAGYFFLDDLCLVSAKGSDLFSYLQTQTTNDVNELKPGQGQNNAIVDRKARVISTFSIHRTGEESAFMLVEAIQKENLLHHLNTFLFREDVTLTSSNHFLLALQGPRSSEIIETFTQNRKSIPEKPNDIIEFTFEGQSALAIAKSLTGEEGCVLVFQTESKESITQKLLEFEQQNLLIQIDHHSREVFRIEAGIPSYGKDINDKNILPETGLEHSSVSYNKGCYIGQEVIARIKTYGAPNFALMGLIIEGESLPLLDSEIKLGSKKLGIIKSSIFSYSLQKNIALAYIQKDHRSPDIDFDVTIDNKPYKIRTCLLPFYQPQTRKDHSKLLQDKALKLYQEQDDLDQPVTLLREAIELDPKNATAYEALGVFLSKQNKLDEAISLMKRLVEINPEEIMARIRTIETIHVSLPLRREHKWAGLTEEIGGYLLVKMTDEDGGVGWGEAPALKDWGGDFGRYFGESPAIAKLVIDTYLLPALSGADPTNIIELHARMDRAMQQALLQGSGGQMIRDLLTKSPLSGRL